MTERSIPSPDDFPFRIADTVRYADTDRQGHVNNAVFATFLETGRAMFLMGGARKLAPPGATFVIARLELDFLAELHWPGKVEIGTCFLRAGRTSFTLAQALFQNGRCAATAETVIVMTDETTRRATPLPEELRQALGALAAAG